MYSCEDCMSATHLLDTNGHCGTVALPENKRLRVLVGEPVDACPTAMGLRDEHVMMLADLVPSASGPGALAGIPRVSMPSYYRDACMAAESWLEAWRAKNGGAK